MTGQQCEQRRDRHDAAPPISSSVDGDDPGRNREPGGRAGVSSAGSAGPQVDREPLRELTILRNGIQVVYLVMLLGVFRDVLMTFFSSRR